MRSLKHPHNLDIPPHNLDAYHYSDLNLHPPTHNLDLPPYNLDLSPPLVHLYY